MAIDVLRQAQGNNLSDTLSTSIGSTDTTIPVNTISIWSANGGKVIIDRGLSTQEIVYCSGVSGSSLVVQAGGRGLEGTTAQGHNVGAAVESVPTAKDWNDLVTSVENVLVKSTGALDTTKVVSQTFPSTFANFVQSGLTIPTSATLSATSVAGTIYYNGVEISVASDGGHTYTASNDCYVDVSNAGAYTYNTVANGAAAPALTANSIRIAKVVTSGTAVTGVTQTGEIDSIGNIIYPSSPKILGTQYYAPSAGGTCTLSFANYSRRHIIQMPAGNITIALPTGVIAFPFEIEIIQDSVGSRTVTWFSGISWGGNTTPTLTTTASYRDSFGFLSNIVGKYGGYIIGQGLNS